MFTIIKYAKFHCSSYLQSINTYECGLEMEKLNESSPYKYTLESR